MNPENPYASPQLPGYSVPALPADGSVHPEVIRQLAGTRGWVLFIAVLLWIIIGIMALAGLVMLIGMGTAAGRSARVSGYAFEGFAFLGAMYAVFAFLYIFPAVKLTKYAIRIRALVYSKRPQDLVAALNEQRVFWKFVGIAFITLLVLYLVSILVIMVAAVNAR